MRPNIFDYATSELSQDAFLAWYCRWADETMTDDMELHTNAREFLKKYIAMQQPDYSEKIRTVFVRRQHEHIDVLITINNDLNVIIEDKVNTGPHGNQLERYAQVITGRKVLLYIKTGDESLDKKKQIVNKGYYVIDRADLLSDMERCQTENEIFLSFTARLRKLEDAIHTYHETEYWERSQLIGFYKDLERVLPKSNWGYVDKVNKGSFVLNWSWLHVPECQIYLEFSFPQKFYKTLDGIKNFKLFVKIKTDEDPQDKLEKHKLRHRLMYKYSNEFVQHANGLVKRPKKLRTGRHMTIAEVGFEQFSKNFASIDILQIKERLRPYVEAVRTFAEMKNIEMSIEK